MPEPFKLTQDEVKTLRDQAPQLTAAEQTIERLERIGIEVPELRERLETAKRIRVGMLQQFAPTGVPRP